MNLTLTITTLEFSSKILEACKVSYMPISFLTLFFKHILGYRQTLAFIRYIISSEFLI
jgi:hypothetical protein